jgi:hypothetical protein
VLNFWLLYSGVEGNCTEGLSLLAGAAHELALTKATTQTGSFGGLLMTSYGS